jgi:hypothetical protein
MFSPEAIGKKRDWIQKWTKAEHRTFAERFVAFTAATLIFDTVDFCAVDTFENIGILRGLVEATSLMKKHNEVLEDFANFVHNEFLIHAASPLSIREIVCDAAEYELEYAVARPSPTLDSPLISMNQPCDENTLKKNITV